MHRPWPLNNAVAAALRVAALMLLAGNAFAQYAISQSPPMSLTPPTNIVLMLDDSGSMGWAYVPDAYGACTGWRRFNAGTFNGIAYNPTITYPAPTIITTTGAKTLITSFTAALIDGFNSGGGTIDLSSGYQPTASSAPGTTNQTYSPHPIQDLALIGVSSASGGGGNGGQGANCGAAYSGNGGGGGNQFGPATGTNTLVPAPAYYYVYNATLTGCTASFNDDNCYQYVRVSATSGLNGTDERQNFANWYSFYRTRHLMIASAAASAMADPVLQGARVTWRALNSCQDMVSGKGCAGWDGVRVDNRIRTFTGAQLTNFYQWLTRVPASSPTPTRSTWTYIGDYFSAPSASNTAIGNTSLGAYGPYGINPNQPTTDPNSGEVACVQNYSITLTDGQWNQDDNTYGAYFGAADATSTALPANPPQPAVPNPPYTPSATPPFAIYGNDTNHDTLSDLAFHYWSNNLRPDLAGSATAVTPYYQNTTGVGGVPTTVDYWNPQNDPATWPHLVQFTIGVGMTSTMNLPGLPWWGNNVLTQYTLNASTNAGYYNLWNGNNPWPVINNGAMQGDPGKAYDLWHAALNSRGLAFSAESAADLIGAMKSSLNRVKVTLNAQSAVATNSSRLNTGSVAYLASYTSSDWHGTLSAYGFTNGVVNTAPNWIWTTDPPGPPTAAFAPFATRSIITSDTAPLPPAPPAASVHNGIPFSTSNGAFNTIWANVTGAGASASAATASANVLSWLRGDASQELRLGGLYRNRPVSILGDIVDSAPVFTLHQNFGYAALPEGMSANPNYLAFLSTVKNAGTGAIYQGQGMVYVGANDGMLHGFDASSGQEVFGYVPHDVIPNMPALADPAYAHHFYVDQTPYVGDAYFCFGPSGCSWKTVLVGTTGAGGQGVFALDVTSPANLETAASAATNNVLWDLDGKGPTDSNGDPDLGYPIGKPMVARLNNGSWAAIFGNGYLSSNGCAVLFIVQLDTGAITKIGTTGVAGTTVCNATNINASNGLGPVTLYDADGNFTTDYVYAGDLQGNLWKFDLHTAALVPTGNVSGGLLLFSAPQGSGCPPPPPAAPPAPQTSVANTCQMITSAPTLGPPLQGLTGTMVYFGTGRIFASGDPGTTSNQAFYAILDQNKTVSFAQLVQQTITDNGTTRTITANPVAPPSMGWYANLPDPGERITVSPVLEGSYVVFATEVPTSSPCTSGGTGWIMAASATSNLVGGSANSNFFAANPGVNGVQSIVGVIEGITVMSSPGGDVLQVGGTQGVQKIQTNASPAVGRISWHELIR